VSNHGSGRPGDMLRRTRRTAGRTLVGLAVLSFLVACGSASAKPASPGTSPISASTLTSAEFLALAPTPPGAVAVSGLPGVVFSEPAMHPGCQPLDVRTAYWTSSSTGPKVAEYLKTHPGPQLLFSGSSTGGRMTGSGSIKKVELWTVFFNPSGTHTGKSGNSELVYKIAPLAPGVGIRLDAEVVPADAVCRSYPPASH
jgi:hypothetical protein